MDFVLDTRSSKVRRDNDVFHISPHEEAILFWLTSGTPLSHFQSVTKEDQSRLESCAAELAERFGITLTDLAKSKLRFDFGKAPAPSRPWAQRTLPLLVHDNLSKRDPDEIFILDASSGAVSVGETLAIVYRIRAALRSCGVQAGDVIALDSAITFETYLINLAAWMHGAVVLRLNSNASVDVIRSQLEIHPPDVVFSARLDLSKSSKHGSRLIALADNHDQGATSEFLRWVAESPEPTVEEKHPADVSPSDLCVVSTTSGTTGKPKAVLLSQHSVWWGCDRSSRKGEFSKSDVFSSATDFIGDCSTYVMTAMPLLARAKVVIPRHVSRQSPLEFANDCMVHKVNCAMLVPTALRSILASGKRFATPFLGSLKYLISASAPFGASMAQSFRECSQAEIIEYLGAREYGGALAARTVGADVISAGGGFENEVLLRIVNEKGQTCAVGETGSMLIVSLGMMDGYKFPKGHKPVESNNSELEAIGYGLWYNTQDLACYDARGGVRIQGRSSDLMKTPDGQIVMPIEIENIIESDENVREACVFSVKDNDGFEHIGGAVIPIAGQLPERFDTLLRQRVQDALGHLKTPRGLMLLDQFPRAAQNKPDKKALTALFFDQVLTAKKTT
ncbi:MAG: class I adenylate-forming enzyme family protein [Pseudomonadota bacterium]